MLPIGCLWRFCVRFSNPRFYNNCFFILILVVTPLSDATASLININTASAHSLALNLPGIGPAKAKAIVEYREQHGPFKTIEAITEVRGIGQGIFTRIKKLISVDDIAPLSGTNTAEHARLAAGNISGAKHESNDRLATESQQQTSGQTGENKTPTKPASIDAGEPERGEAFTRAKIRAVLRQVRRSAEKVSP